MLNYMLIFKSRCLLLGVICAGFISQTVPVARGAPSQGAQQTCKGQTCKWHSDSLDADSVILHHRRLHVEHIVKQAAKGVGGLKKKQIKTIADRLEVIFSWEPDISVGQAEHTAWQEAQALKASQVLDTVGTELGGTFLPGTDLAIQYQAVMRFKELESQWINSLPADSVIRGVGYVYGEVGFVLAGAKPCTMLYVPEEPSYALNMAAFLQTIMDEFELEDEGYRLHTVSDNINTRFQGAVVIANHLHLDHDRYVAKAFLKTQPQPTEPVPDSLIGWALGYPTPYGDERVLYINKSECKEKEIRSGNTSCIMLEYFQDDFQEIMYPAIMKHYEAYRRAFARQLGQVLGIDLRHSPRLQHWWTSDAANDLRAAEQSF